MKKIKPLAERVVLKAIDETKNITESGIYLPESENKERPFMYEVVEVWTGSDEKPITVKVWDRVLAGQYSWDEVKVDWEEFKIVGIEYVLAIVE